MKQVISLVKKDFLVDWRQQNPIWSILLYLVSTILVSYFAFKGFVDTEIWNALFWVIMLFFSIQAISKSFFQEERRTLYYFFTVKPGPLIVAKLVYSFLYILVLSAIFLLVFSALFGNPVQNFGLFALNIVLGCLGLSSTFTMISIIASSTGNRSVMMVVLGFPVIIPLLLLVTSNSGKILEGYIWMQVQGNMLGLISLDLIIIALAFVLFPFTWKS